MHSPACFRRGFPLCVVARLARRRSCSSLISEPVVPAARAGSAPERAGEIRLLRFRAVVVAVLLCRQRGTQSPDERRATRNAGRGRFPSSCTGCGRNMSAAFRNSARCRRRGSTATSVASMLDLMPGPRLVYHEWDRHGTCSGVPANAFFDTIRKARAVVKIPPQYLDLQSPLTVTPDAGRGRLRCRQSGADAGGHRRHLRRPPARRGAICLTRDLQFRDCPEIDRRSCKRDKLVMPPVRGG